MAIELKKQFFTEPKLFLLSGTVNISLKINRKKIIEKYLDEKKRENTILFSKIELDNLINTKKDSNEEFILLNIHYNQTELFNKLEPTSKIIQLRTVINGDIKTKTFDGYKPKKPAKAFDSQITFAVKPENSIFQIKVFRTGVIKISNGKREDMEDIKLAFLTLSNYFLENFKKILEIDEMEIIETSKLTDEMKNYKMELIEPNQEIWNLDFYNTLLKNYEKYSIVKGFDRLQNKKEMIDVEFFNGVKSIKDLPEEEAKKIIRAKGIKAKVYPSGKINIFSSKGQNKIHEWFEDFFTEFSDNFLINRKKHNLQIYEMIKLEKEKLEKEKLEKEKLEKEKEKLEKEKIEKEKKKKKNLWKC